MSDEKEVCSGQFTGTNFFSIENQSNKTWIRSKTNELQVANAEDAQGEGQVPAGDKTRIIQ